MADQLITPFLWYDTQAREAAELYVSVFPDSLILESQTLENTPSGTVETLTICLSGYRIRMMSAGPPFKFSPAISFAIRCGDVEQVTQVWEQLSAGGKVLMELGEYPFSPRYGWLEDRYGLSWQLMASDDPNEQFAVVPTLLFVGAQCGNAEAAMTRYVEVFDNSELGQIVRYGEGQGPDAPGSVMFGSFTLAGQEFAAMDSAHDHQFTFTEAISFEVGCETQGEIDRYWSELSADPAAEQCGWLKDAYSVSWQIVPTALDRMLSEGTPEQVDRVTQCFLQMKKMDIAELERAFNA